jgi:hypothetical protein
MIDTLIEKGTYKGFDYEIRFASGKDWGDWKDKFFVKADFPFSNVATKSIQSLRESIKKEINEWIDYQPKNDDDWVSLVSECVIQTGYEDWHVDEKLAMNVLERYAKFKNRSGV